MLRGRQHHGGLRQSFAHLLGNSDHSIEREEHLISSFLERQPDAFILTGLTHSQRSMKLLSFSGVPVVETWETDGVPIDMSVGFSNIAAGRSLAQALIAKGYRRFGFVGGRLNKNRDLTSATKDSRRRLRLQA